MPEITIAEDIHTRVAQFKQVIEAVIEEEISFEACVELTLQRGIEGMVADLLELQEQPVLLAMFQQLSSEYPAQLSQYMAEVLKRGTIVIEREKVKRRLGFLPPTDVDIRS